jgi:hypothetical protein
MKKSDIAKTIALIVIPGALPIALGYIFYKKVKEKLNENKK